MSFNGIITTQIESGHKRLSAIGKTAGYLLDGVFITLDKQGLEPLAPAELSFQTVGALLNSGSEVSIKDSNIFLNSTTKRIRDYCHKIVGRSPGLIEDIARAITKPVGDLIDLALKPIKDTVGGIVSGVHGIIDNGVSFIQKGFDSAVNTIASWIDTGFKIIGEGVTFIQSTITVLLDGVATALNFAVLVLQKCFDTLLVGFEALLRITPEAMLNLQNELQRLIEEQQANLVKRYVKKAE